MDAVRGPHAELRRRLAKHGGSHSTAFHYPPRIFWPNRILPVFAQNRKTLVEDYAAPR